MDAVRKLGAALARNVPGGAGNPDAARDRPPETPQWRKGKILAVDGATDTCTVTTDGLTSRSGVPSLYAPVVNDIVWCVEQPPLLLVVGKSASF